MKDRIARSRPGGVRVSTLTRLWKTAQSLAQIHVRAAQPGDAMAGENTAFEDKWTQSPLASIDQRFWGAYELRILDLRPTQVFCQRHIPESGSIPAPEIEARIYELPPKWRPLVVASDDSREARDVAQMLRERGWQRVEALRGSLNGWPGPWESGPPQRYLWEPTPVVQRWASRLKIGKVLDLGCGSGRDAVYLAMRGHEVIAVDLLPDALAKTDALATRMGVTIATRQMDLRKQRPPVDDGFDAILMIRFLERSLLPWMAKALRPGGTLFFETFVREQEDTSAQRDAGTQRDASAQQDARARQGVSGPQGNRWILESQEALRAFMCCADNTAGADESKRNSGPSLHVLEYLELPDASGVHIARLVARKP